MALGLPPGSASLSLAEEGHLQARIDMQRATSQVRKVAGRVIAHETKGIRAPAARGLAAFDASEKLRPHLAILMGSAGVRALFSRALALANADLPWLRSVHVGADGAMDGLEEMNGRVAPAQMVEGGTVLLARLLGLLEAFIGDALTMRIVSETWPKLSLEKRGSGKRSSE